MERVASSISYQVILTRFETKGWTKNGMVNFSSLRSHEPLMSLLSGTGAPHTKSLSRFGDAVGAAPPWTSTSVGAGPILPFFRRCSGRCGRHDARWQVL